MSEDKKGRSGWHRATLRKACKRPRHFTERRVRVAALIRGLAVWGLLPVVAADWLLRRISGEQR